MDGSTYTVAELARAIGRAVARTFPDEIWVQGEIRDLNRAGSGHVYFTLLDTNGGDDAPASLPVTLFASDKVAVNRVLARSGAMRMTEGVEVRIRGRVSHYPQRGTIQLRMSWIGTDFTLGKLAAERDRLVKSLASLGLLERNQRLAVPPVPLCVGLITSEGSAAHADFLHELSASGFAWRVGVFDARVQGVEAEADIVRGLAVLGKTDVDVIALVRGGGAQTDLAAFDSEAVAVAIAKTPIPVLTGIGHETDLSVADLAARSFKTPTACAASLVALVSAFAGRIDQLAMATGRAVRSRLVLATSTLEHSRHRLARSAVTAGSRTEQSLADFANRTRRASRSRLTRDRMALRHLAIQLNRTSSRQLSVAEADVERIAGAVGIMARKGTASAGHRLDELEHRLSLVDPALLLARGWSITRTEDGVVVLDPGDVSSGMTLQTTVAGGHIASVVSEQEEVRGG